jgi:hypothetical protein
MDDTQNTSQQAQSQEVPAPNQGTGPGSVAGADWTAQMQLTEARPRIGRQPNQLKALLLQTLKSGAVTVPLASLPIKVKSLRTQVVAIAKGQRAISHVIERSGTISMWLEPRPAGAAYKRTAKAPKSATKGKRPGKRGTPSQG